MLQCRRETCALGERLGLRLMLGMQLTLQLFCWNVISCACNIRTKGVMQPGDETLPCLQCSPGAGKALRWPRIRLELADILDVAPLHTVVMLRAASTVLGVSRDSQGVRLVRRGGCPQQLPGAVRVARPQLPVPSTGHCDAVHRLAIPLQVAIHLQESILRGCQANEDGRMYQVYSARKQEMSVLACAT